MISVFLSRRFSLATETNEGGSDETHAMALGSGTSTDEFQALLATFGNLTTVAGTGNISEKNVSGWQASMEGASALDAELSRPHMAMADSAGNIFIADMDAPNWPISSLPMISTS